MAGPREILALDGVKPGRYRLDSRSLHLYRGELWEWQVEDLSCLLCSGMENAENQTLTRLTIEGVELSHCLYHGELESVVFSILRMVVVVVGTIKRDFKDLEESCMFFPVDMDPKERERVTHLMIEKAHVEALEEDYEE